MRIPTLLTILPSSLACIDIYFHYEKSVSSNTAYTDIDVYNDNIRTCSYNTDSGKVLADGETWRYECTGDEFTVYVVYTYSKDSRGEAIVKYNLLDGIYMGKAVVDESVPVDEGAYFEKKFLC